jgi:L-fuconolactonase
VSSAAYPLLDAHQHYWDPARGDYFWLPDSGVLARAYLPADLRPLRERHGVVGTIAVQAAPTIAESEFVLGLAADAAAGILGVVGWVALDRPLRDLEERLLAQPLLVGVRPMLQDLDDPAWIVQPRVVANLRELAARGLRFDILSRPRELPFVAEALEQVPELPAVVDHLSKPSYRDEIEPGWLAALERLAANPLVHCKLSGLVAEVEAPRGAGTFRRHVEAVCDLFGARRLLFGSDWPVCNLAGGYDAVVALFDELTSGLSAADQRLVRCDNARAFYGVEAGVEGS